MNTTPPRHPATAPLKTINLALQGGGAHGAYTWGVLDRLLEEERLVIEGISGTSAGAINAAVLLSGYAMGGRAGAREALANFWKTVSEMSALMPFSKTPLSQFFTGWNFDWSPAYQYFDMLSRVLSPYDLNPFNVNPLRSAIDELLDHDAVRAFRGIKLFVTATHVASGQPRVFGGHEITTDVLLASTCLPFLFQAVQVEGEYYWDGGYTGNPAIWPLIYHCKSEDVVLVQINPIHRDGVPKSAGEIINRLNEITFNSSLVAEMRAIEFVHRLLQQERLDPERYKDVKMHLIYSMEELKELNASSKMNTGFSFLQYLRDIGRQAATEWLTMHFDDIGERSTVDIRKKFLCGPGREPSFSELGHQKHAKHHHQQQGAHPEQQD